MPPLPIALLARDAASPASLSPTAIGLLIALVVLILLSLLLVGALLFIRRRRRARKQLDPPSYNEKRSSASSTSSHRRVMVRPSESVYVYQEKKSLLENSDGPPSRNTSLPEIRITFPEEYDASGNRTSGRVVVVRVGDTSLGLEPLSESLPEYRQADGERYHSIDLERVGGLTEKEGVKLWS